MLFEKNIEPKCEYCSRGDYLADKDGVACIKRGVMSPDDHCRRFKYDPLKRVPDAPRTLVVGNYSEEDFSL